MSTDVGMTWKKVAQTAPVVGVDQDNGIIFGMVVAQEGPFKTQGRGEFDGKSLKSIVKLMKQSPKGLKSRFTHPDESNDGLGKYLGRVKNPRLGMVVVESHGEIRELQAVRGDLHVAESSRSTPSGDLGGYVMELAAEDSDAISSSLVLEVDEEYRLNKDGTVQTDADGRPLPPLWRPSRLHASDIVDTGDAVDGLLGASLSADGLPGDVFNTARKLLSKQFAGKPRSFVEPRLRAWCDRALAFLYSDEESDAQRAATESRRLRLELTKQVLTDHSEM